MGILELASLQGTLFLMMLVGALLKRRGILDENGRTCLTDLCVNIVIPCNIFKGFLISFEPEILSSCARAFLCAFILQLLNVLLNRFLYNGFPTQQKKVMQYCTIVSNGGFLGNPVAEGIYGDLGLLYASVFLIPTRLVMWSIGTSYFVADAKMDRKKFLKSVLTHPCLVAVYLGILCMVLQPPLPSVITSAAKYIGSCNSALTMFIIGTILVDIPLREIVNRSTVLFSILRLALLPAAAFGIGWLFGLRSAALGVSVLMTGMPAGATSAIFAARYGSDASFATKCVVFTTLLSMFTLPLWEYFLL